MYGQLGGNRRPAFLSPVFVCSLLSVPVSLVLSVEKFGSCVWAGIECGQVLSVDRCGQVLSVDRVGSCVWAGVECGQVWLLCVGRY